MQCISGLDKASLRPSAIFTFDIKSCRFLFVNYGCLVEGLNIFLPPSSTASALFPSTQEQLERGGRMDFQCHINLPPPHQPSYFHPKKHKLTTLLFSKNIPQNLKPSNFAQNLEPSLLFSPTKNINLKPSYFHPQLRTTPSLLFSPTIPSLSDLIFLL